MSITENLGPGCTSIRAENNDTSIYPSKLVIELDMLPTELYSNILEGLGYQDLLTCMQVCSLFRDLICGSASLQYIIELALAGQQDGSNFTASSATRLELLKRHQIAWKELKWSQEIKVPMRDGGLWELYDGVLGQSTPEGTLVFNQLPSDLRSIEEKEWSLGPDFGMIIRDFAMDPAQDLLVLIESPDWSLPDSGLKHQIHLRSLSTGKPHPLAAQGPILSLPQIYRDLTMSYTIQIFGNLLGVMILPSSTENELAIWNWAAGPMLTDIVSDDILSFSILSDSWVLLCGLDPLYGNPALYAVNFKQESPERQGLDMISAHIFEYPELDDKVFATDIDIRSDSGPPQSTSTAPFSHDRKNFLIVITIWIVIDNALKCLTHFIPSSHVISLVESEDSCVLPWADWMPDKTRLFFPRQYPSDTWVCYVHGMKFTISEPPRGGKSGYSVRLFDFNQLAPQRDAKKAPIWIDTSTTLLGEGEPFCQDVATCLQFWSQTIALEECHEHCAVLCSEDHIIVVDPECKEYRVLVF